MGIKKHELHGQINEMPSIQLGLYSQQENNPKEKSKDHICTTASIGTNWCDYLHACKKKRIRSCADVCGKLIQC